MTNQFFLPFFFFKNLFCSLKTENDDWKMRPNSLPDAWFTRLTWLTVVHRMQNKIPRGVLFGLFLVVVSCFKIPISTVKVVSLLELAIVREILKISFKKIYQLSRLWCLPLNLWTINIESEMCHHVFGYRQSVWNLSMDLLHIENSLSHVDW